MLTRNVPLMTYCHSLSVVCLCRNSSQTISMGFTASFVSSNKII